jgi:hypothetical protein
MTTRRDPATVSALDAMTGRRLPGGCDDCAAYQVMSRCADGLYVLTVHHDPTCPHLDGRTA